MEQLDEKFEELHRIATRCDVATRKLRDDIADSMEEANKLARMIPPGHETQGSGKWWTRWWITFLQEWGYRCFARCLSKSGNLKDYKTIQNQWLSNFEPVWAVGCDIARIDRLNTMKKSLSGYISRRSEPIAKTDEEKLWKWLSGFDEAALKAIDIYREKQRAIIHSMKESREYDEDSLLGKLKRFMSE